MFKMHEVTKRFRETVLAWKLWGKGEPILLAVSGGIDSMVLLDLLRRLSPKERSVITAVHYNHKLRGAESEEDVRFVKKICREWEVPLIIGEAPPWQQKNNLQERARKLRYQFFFDQAKKIGAGKIATAHQADDQAETFLIRWLQGAGLKGLCGIPLVGNVGAQLITPLQVVRPLLFITRTEIANYATKFEVPFREDSSNQDRHYLRNQVRKILAELRQLNPGLERRFAVNALLLAADEDYLEAETERVARGMGDPFSVSVYQQLPRALRFRLLQQMVRRLAENLCLSGDDILKADHLLFNPAPRRQLDLPHRIRFEKDYVTFRFIKGG